MLQLPRIVLVLLALAAHSVCAAADAHRTLAADATPDATITVSGGVVALGVGYEWTRGVLTFRHHTYSFWMRGVSVMDVGMAQIAGSGDVYQLHSLADFAGNYAGSTFGSAVAHGESLSLIKNEKGVSIRVRSAESGMRLNFSGEGVRIRLTAPDLR